MFEKDLILILFHLRRIIGNINLLLKKFISNIASLIFNDKSVKPSYRYKSYDFVSIDYFISKNKFLDKS
jgi:hypothetical protein